MTTKYRQNIYGASIRASSQRAKEALWNGTDQKRFVAIVGDRLTLTVRPPAGDVVDVIWKRAE
jgi:hypothetical protein